MNQRNVDALKVVLSEALETSSYHTPVFIEFLAKELTAYGVLVPSVLQWDEAVKAVQTAGLFDVGTDGVAFTARLALALERTAKGEA